MFNASEASLSGSVPIFNWRPASQQVERMQTRLDGRLPTQNLLIDPALTGLPLAHSQILVFGAGPGVGKTSLACFAGFTALQHNRELNLYIANAETPFDILYMRELSRHTGIPANRLINGQLDDDERQRASQILRDQSNILARVFALSDTSGHPFAALKASRPGLLLVDYVQKYARGGSDVKVGIAHQFDLYRALADLGWAVMVIAATSRTSGAHGHSSRNQTAASFRDSSDIEYNADAAYIVCRDVHNGSTRQLMTLKCVKNRHDEMRDIQLNFEPRLFRFSTPVANQQERTVGPNENPLIQIQRKRNAGPNLGDNPFPNGAI